MSRRDHLNRYQVRPGITKEVFAVIRPRGGAMDIRARFRASLAPAAVVITAWTSLVFGAMPVPGISQVVEYDPLRLPVLSDDPTQARPAAVGEMAEGGGTLNLRIGLPGWDGPVDLYLGLQASFLPGELFVFESNGGLYPVSQAGLLPWKAGVSTAVEEDVFEGGLDVSALPPGVYTLFLAATPAAILEAVSLWVTSFFVPGFSLQEVEAGILSTLSPDPGFRAFWLALDEGYSLEQTVAGAMTGRLRADGRIYGFQGNLVAPENPSPDIFANLLETAARESTLRAEASDEIDSTAVQLIDRIGAVAEKIGKGEGRNLGRLALCLALIEAGYPPSQAAGAMLALETLESPEELVFFTGAPPRLVVMSPDGTVIPASGPSRGVCSLTKSVSDLRVTLTGDETLGIKTDQVPTPSAAGEWTAQVTGGTGPYVYFFYWGIPDFSLDDHRYSSKEPSLTAEYVYYEAKTYHLVVRVVDTSDQKEANSSVFTVTVRYEPPVFPYTHCEISVNVNEIREFQGLDDPVRGFYHQSIGGIGQFRGSTFVSDRLDPALFPVPDCQGRMEITVYYEPSLVTGIIVENFSVWRTCTAAGGYGRHDFEVRGEDLTSQVTGLYQPELSGHVAGDVACTHLNYIRDQSSSPDGSVSSRLTDFFCTSDSFVLIRCFTP